MVLETNGVINYLQQAIDDDVNRLAKLRNSCSDNPIIALTCHKLRQKIDGELLPSLLSFTEELEDMSAIDDCIPLRINTPEEPSDPKAILQAFLQTLEFKPQTNIEID